MWSCDLLLKLITDFMFILDEVYINFNFAVYPCSCTCTYDLMDHMTSLIPRPYLQGEKCLGDFWVPFLTTRLCNTADQSLDPICNGMQ